MKKILFVCLGNICRSPMAEYCMKDIVSKAGKKDLIYIESAATSCEELGNPVYPPVRKKLKEHGIDCAGKTARQISKADYDKFDLIVCMENSNVKRTFAMLGGDPCGKIKRLLDFTDSPRDIADPWYTGDFGGVYRQIVAGCEGLLKHLNF